ncbi:alpha-ribazole phosphatase family protein [Metapseudomonas resinovorans]|uniref:Putative alpha-ribazole-5'-phosphate phosphatase n=1 Tax=Metapseudomonas resinovorans NBRC 106553 TaxID=1245471 RepID=S6ATQ5_METRE|nr:alpha-ribazole phosphatase family protein [Pseudomonas resinovorans]BAN47561.1 putative alpha-ribazole-5'-phosphate phosphatase [Pseudomonas resinovorans NBRC 106553]
MKLDLLRHGETERGGGFRGSLDDALTEKGWAQMRAGIEGAGPWDVLVSSPLQRCAAFARELEQRLGLPLHFDADLRELHFGQWEGRSAAELMEDQAEGLGLFWNDPYSFTPPEGETLLDFEARVLAAGERLLERFVGQRVLLVTHGGVIRVLVARARQLPRAQLMQVEVAHGELFRLDVGEHGLRERP